ncbi:MAG: TonB-dependent receptor, partial [Thermodesulfovibrionia bacterium]|nr:TonB-dependent receptor [Thermodesulfovibrionia bacterium]
GSFKYYYGHIKYGGRLSKNVTLTMGGHLHRSDNADLTEYYDEYAPTDLTVGADVIAAADRENFIFRTGSYTGNLKLDINDKFTLGYNRSYFRHPTTSGDKPDQSRFTDDVKWETMLSTMYGEYRFESGDKLSGKTSMSHHTYELSTETNYKNVFTNFETGHKYARSKKWMFEQQLNYKVADNHIVVGGFSIEDFYALPKTYDLLGKEYDPDKAGSEQGFFYGGTNDTLPVKIIELNYKNYGIYLQSQSKWSSVLSSTLGVRYDYNTRYKGATNPRGGVVITPGETTTVKLLYGEAFLAPSPYNAYSYHWGSFDQGYDAVKGLYVSSFMGLPNPDLEPEKSKTTEINIIQEVTPAFVLTLSGYYTRVKDMIFDVVQNTPSYYIDGGEVLAWKRLENVGTAKFYGGELLANYHADIGGIKLKPWGSYSYVDGKVDNGTGVESDHIYIAKHKLKVGLTAAYSRYSITPIVRWIGKTNTRWTDPNDPTKRQQVEDYILVNLNMDAKNVAKNLSVALNVHNLLDKRYYNSGGGSNNFPSSPQEPRRIVLKLDYKF